MPVAQFTKLRNRAFDDYIPPPIYAQKQTVIRCMYIDSATFNSRPRMRRMKALSSPDHSGGPRSQTVLCTLDYRIRQPRHHKLSANPPPDHGQVPIMQSAMSGVPAWHGTPLFTTQTHHFLFPILVSIPVPRRKRQSLPQNPIPTKLTLLWRCQTCIILHYGDSIAALAAGMIGRIPHTTGPRAKLLRSVTKMDRHQLKSLRSPLPFPPSITRSTQ